MSFLKKLLGTHNKTPEQIEAERIKAEQKMIEKQQREAERQAKKAQEKALQEKYIGLGFGKGFDFSLYKGTIAYFENSILRPDEEVLHSIKAEYDKTKKREIKGLLIATNQRLVFVSSGVGYGQFFEEFDYRKMNGISHANDGLFEKEIYIDMGRSRKKFDDIIPDERFQEFLGVVMTQINSARNTPQIKTKTRTNTKDNPVIDKYAALEKIAKLKEQGVLTEEEFLIEKEKILKM